MPLTDTVVAAARAGESVRAEASPAGVSAAMATAATISIFMGALGVGYASKWAMSWNLGFLVKPAAATACPRSRW